jgi:hypothetical protein
MLQSAITSNQLLMRYGRALVSDVADDRMAEQPLAGVYHPAWILGHLAFSADSGAALTGNEKLLPREWEGLFGAGSKVSSVRGDYAPKDELLRAFEQSYERLRRLATEATTETLTKPSPSARMRDNLPIVQDGIVFLLTGHLGVHLGQLSAWRRMNGLPPLF